MRVTVDHKLVVSFPIELIHLMTRKARRWFRFSLLLMLAISAQVPACEYGPHQNADGGQASDRISLTAPPQSVATLQA
jgi:hypothetical protein